MCWVAFGVGLFVGGNIAVVIFAVVRAGGRDLEDG